MTKRHENRVQAEAPKAAAPAEPNYAPVEHEDYLVPVCANMRRHLGYRPWPKVDSETASKKDVSSRDMVRWFMSSLSPAPAPQPTPQSKDLEGLTRVIRAVISAADEEVISEREADAVIRFLAECFTRRRFDDVVTKLTMPKHGAWFVVQSHIGAEAE